MSVNTTLKIFTFTMYVLLDRLNNEVGSVDEWVDLNWLILALNGIQGMKLVLVVLIKTQNLKAPKEGLPCCNKDVEK